MCGSAARKHVDVKGKGGSPSTPKVSPVPLNMTILSSQTIVGPTLHSPTSLYSPFSLTIHSPS